ncbi:hypothetical protein NHX12_009420 [Muraenolepis orangiensis]|uniref:Uncharacterized protein n=1 Tax=Muraenolepis orangiensis TaxID=630683 RepID=A0A9Q0IC73_9TELE|nr:hypothetical protein NHX12_009420 [Muraenolepis orangiensis]
MAAVYWNHGDTWAIRAADTSTGQAYMAIDFDECSDYGKVKTVILEKEGMGYLAAVQNKAAKYPTVDNTVVSPTFERTCGWTIRASSMCWIWTGRSWSSSHHSPMANAGKARPKKSQKLA